jgi:hypothetical protein
MIQAMIRDALARARQGPRATFAQTLLKWLPGTATHVHIDFDLLRNDELALLGEYRDEYLD